MYTNPFVAELVAKESMDDTLRRAEQARLVRTVEGESKPRRWQLPRLTAFRNLLTAVVRAQFNHRARA